MTTKKHSRLSIKFHLDNSVREDLHKLLKKSNRTLTSLVKRYLERLLNAYALSKEYDREELIILLTQKQYFTACNLAGSENKLPEVLRKVLLDWLNKEVT